MDLEEWEFLPNNGLLEIHESGNKNIFFGNFPTQFVDTTEESRIPNQLVPIQIQLEPNTKQQQQQQLQEDDEVTKEVITEEQDQVSQVFFKKETEYENMKMDSPKFSNKNSMSQIDAAGPLQFEDKEDKVIKKRDNMEEDDNTEENNNSGLNLWNWSLTGIGAICSIGVAATIFIFIGNHQQKKQKKNQKLKFQFSDDQKMKQEVHQQSTAVNEAISEVRGGGSITKKLTVEGLLLSSLEHIQERLSVS